MTVNSHTASFCSARSWAQSLTRLVLRLGVFACLVHFRLLVSDTSTRAQIISVRGMYVSFGSGQTSQSVPRPRVAIVILLVTVSDHIHSRRALPLLWWTHNDQSTPQRTLRNMYIVVWFWQSHATQVTPGSQTRGVDGNPQVAFFRRRDLTVGHYPAGRTPNIELNSHE